MALLNYSTKIDVTRTVNEITAILAQQGANRILQEYDSSGNAVGLKWSLDGQYGRLSYAMPINHEAIFAVLTNEGLIFTRNDEKRREQARRVAWRILKVWIQAQLALLETGMVVMEEIFLPYMLSDNDGRTLYETLAAGQFQDSRMVSRDAIALGPASDFINDTE